MVRPVPPPFGSVPEFDINPPPPYSEVAPVRFNTRPAPPIPLPLSNQNSNLMPQNPSMAPMVPPRPVTIDGHEQTVHLGDSPFEIVSYRRSPAVPPRPLEQSPRLPERPSARSSARSSTNDLNSFRNGEELAPPLPSRSRNHSRDDDMKSVVNGVANLRFGKDLIDLDSDSTSPFDTQLPTSAPPQIFPESVHPVQPPTVIPSNKPIATNKFYGNFLLGDQTLTTWTHPYSLAWSKDADSLGIAIDNIRASQRVFATGDVPQYFLCPLNIKSLVFSAGEFGTANDFSLTLRDPTSMSLSLNLMLNGNQYIWMPLLQGMGFVTAVYYSLTPVLKSLVSFRTVTEVQGPNNNLQKYLIVLNNDVTWTLYVDGNGQKITLNLVDGNTLASTTSFAKCTFQVVASDCPSIDGAAGCYPVSCDIFASTSGSTGKYSFNYSTEGTSNIGATLMYALPHQVCSFAPSMSMKKIDSTLDSTTLGAMSGYITTSFDFQMEIPTDLAFMPFTTLDGKGTPSFTADQINNIRAAATMEVQEDVSAATNLDSMYFAGKAFAKYAWILFCCQYVLKDSNLVSILMPKLKAAFEVFIQNNQILPLTYDTTWKGVRSSGTQDQDFGNPYYNDHHFHYGYHVITAAIIANVDRELGSTTWLEQNKEWVQTLIRDYSNPSDDDMYFPQFRSFDWFQGHSWAKGLFPSGDGKDQESSSEDLNASYAIKLWGLTTGDQGLVDMSNIQMGIMKCSFNSYFLYKNDNTVEPSEFIPNKVSGILFENKIDCTTYFGNLLQYIHMIHAIPITSASSFVRSPTFVQQEWDEKLEPIADGVTDGWRGLLMLNLALVDPDSSYKFFSTPSFNMGYLDGGQSLTWSLTYSAAFTS